MTAELIFEHFLPLSSWLSSAGINQSVVGLEFRLVGVEVRDGVVVVVGSRDSVLIVGIAVVDGINVVFCVVLLFGKEVLDGSRVVGGKKVVVVVAVVVVVIVVDGVDDVILGVAVAVVAAAVVGC